MYVSYISLKEIASVGSSFENSILFNTVIS
jgi:hypothetical protein